MIAIGMRDGKMIRMVRFTEPEVGKTFDIPISPYECDAVFIMSDQDEPEVPE